MTIHELDTKDELRFSIAFTEWEMRYQENPDQFESDFARLTKAVKAGTSLGDAAAGYGVVAARYFAEILAQVDIDYAEILAEVV